MKSIKYDRIAEGMTVSPHYTRDVQEGTRQRLEALLKALTGGTSQVVVLHGCKVTRSNNYYRMTAGAVYYNGDLYSVPAFPNTEATGGQVPVFVVDEQFTANALHGDNNFYPTFFDKQMRLQMGSAFSGIVPHDQVVKLENKISEFIGIDVLESEIDNKLSKAGGTMTGDLDMGGNQSSPNSSRKITNLHKGEANYDAVNKRQLDDKLSKQGGIMTGDLDMGANQFNFLNYRKITKLHEGEANYDAVNKSQLDDKLSKAGGTMTGDLDMGANQSNFLNYRKITNLHFAENDYDAVVKRQLDSRALAVETSHIHVGTGGVPPSLGKAGDIFLYREAESNPQIFIKNGMREWRRVDN